MAAMQANATIVPAPEVKGDRVRVDKLRRLGVLDSLPERVYDDLVLLASQICGTPIALVSLVDAERVWFKAKVGLEANEAHRDLAFCSHAIAAPDPLFIVADAQRDDRFEANPLVAGNLKLRFYAGALIATSTGEPLGTVCVIDTEPRELTLSQRSALQALARQASALLELRDRTQVAEAAQRAVQEQITRRKLFLEHVTDGVVVHRSDFSIAEVSASFPRMLGYTEEEVLGMRPWQWDAVMDTRDKVVKQFPKLSAGKTSFVTVWRRKDGTLIDVEISVSRIESQGGTEALLVCRDITERNRTQRELRSTSDLLEQMGKLAKVGGWQLDLLSDALTWTDQVYEIHGLDRSARPELHTSIDFYAPASREVIRDAVQAAIDDGTPFDHELEFITARNVALWVRAQGVAVRSKGKTVRLFGAFQDITERKRAEQALVDGERRLRMIADNVPAIVNYIDRERRYSFVNAHAGRVLGIAPGSMLGRTIADVRGDQFYEDISPYADAALMGDQVSFQNSTIVQGRLHHYQSTYIPDFDAAGRVVGFYAMNFDISELKEKQRQLDVLARVDALTGMANRRHFDERLRQAMDRSRLEKVPSAVMFLDVDHFKAINDLLGHAGGDIVLCEFAKRLFGAVRSTDFVARLGGDEFAVLLENVGNYATLINIAEKIMSTLRTVILVNDSTVQVTASIGVATYDGGEMTAAQLLAAADAALYSSKENGRNQFRIV